MSLYERSSGTWMTYRSGGWEAGILRCSSILIDGQQVVGPRAAAIASPTGGSVADEECRTAIGAVLDALREHGLIAS